METTPPMRFAFDLPSAPRRPDADLCFAHVCDTHVEDEESARIVADAVPAINALAPDFILFGGDLTNAGDAPAFTVLREATAGLDAPVHFLPGNHDMIQGKGAFARTLGPLNFRFDAGPYTVLGLDSTGRTSLTWEGLFTGATIRWLDQRLRALPPDRPLILFTHHGIRSEQPHAPKRNLLWDVLNWKPIHELLAPFDLFLACAGHAHENARQQWGRTTMLWTDLLSTVRATHVDTPPGFRMVWLRGREVDSVWVPARPLTTGRG